MRRLFSALLCAGLVGASGVALAAAGKVHTVSGQVTSGSKILKVGDEFDSGATIVTGKDGMAVLRFEDGQIIALEHDTEFRVDNYKYDAKAPEKGSAFFSMLKGALRALTGSIGQSNKEAFALKTPQATIGIRGSDWMAALRGNSLYTGVRSGGIVLNNSRNALLVDPGQYSVTLGGNASQLVGLSQLPAGIFGSLPQMGLGGIAGAGGVGAGAGVGAVGGLSAAGVAGIGAVVAGVAAAASSGGGGEGSSSSHGSHGR